MPQTLHAGEGVIYTAGEESVVGAAGDGSAGERGKKKLQIAGLYRPPTHEELRTLKETQNLFQSNLMRLQVFYRHCFVISFSVYVVCVTRSLSCWVKFGHLLVPSWTSG